MSELTDSVITVALYPIKSCGPATVDGRVPASLPLGRTGFEVYGIADRDFLLYDPNESAFVSQRGWNNDRRTAHPEDRRLAMVSVDILPDHLAVTSGVGQLALPATLVEGDRRTISIFGKDLPVIDQGEDAARYFSLLLGRAVQVVRANRGQPRLLPERYRREGAVNEVAGADGMPLLVLSQATLAAQLALNKMRPDEVTINRFRGNIVLSGEGIGPGREDYIDPWTIVRIGDVGAWVVKACSRCPIPNTNQLTGEYDGLASRALRGRAGIIFTGEQGVFYGQNAVHAEGSVGKTISVGDEVVVGKMADTPNVEFRVKQ